MGPSRGSISAALAFGKLVRKIVGFSDGRDRPCFSTSAAWPAAAANGDFADTVDVGGGRKMYIECRGTGSPTVLIVPGGRASADEWIKGSPVFDDVAKFTRICAYDRPGTQLPDDRPSRSDPVPMPPRLDSHPALSSMRNC